MIINPLLISVNLIANFWVIKQDSEVLVRFCKTNNQIQSLVLIGVSVLE